MGQYDAELIQTANYIATPGKGILAADESTNTIASRFKGAEIENTEDLRRTYRDLLFSTPDEVTQYISGVILYDETFFQKATDGTLFPQLLKSKKVIPGIKVDKGTVILPGTDGETATQGLDDLAGRCKKYYEGGARFAKWRAVLKIDVAKNLPSQQAIQENAWGLARYAAICQENGLVPIVEPEVLMDGTHPIEVSAAVTERVLAATFKALNDNKVLLEGILLKPNMVLAGTQSATKASPEQVAEWTVRTLSRTVPPAVPGIVFLSGGQSEVEATTNLNAINKAKGKNPWTLSFSFGRALQASVIKTWKGDTKNLEDARAIYIHRARSNGLAVLGKYEGEKASAGASESLYVKNYTY